MTRDEFVIAINVAKDDNLRADRRNPEARQLIGDVMRSYLAALGCAPSMVDWATDQIQTRYEDEPVTVSSAFVVADELERMVRA